ncbi:MAG: hypothetical protein H0V35_15340 [Nitrospira sp.]|nr:hypothetical protein [Nitrospira sp.]
MQGLGPFQGKREKQEIIQEKIVEQVHFIAVAEKAAQLIGSDVRFAEKGGIGLPG